MPDARYTPSEPDVSGRDHDAGHSAQGAQTASVARPETSGEPCIGTCQTCGAYWDLLLARPWLEVASNAASRELERLAGVEEQLEAVRAALDEWERDCDGTALQRDDLRARLDRIRAAVESDPFFRDTNEAVRDFLIRETEPGWLHVPGISGKARTALMDSNPANSPLREVRDGVTPDGGDVASDEPRASLSGPDPASSPPDPAGYIELDERGNCPHGVHKGLGCRVCDPASRLS